MALSLCRLIPLLLLSMLAGGHAVAAQPRPFDASYRLEVDGWPNATVEHRLVRESHHWLSAMRGTAAAVARSTARSRFALHGGDVQPLYSASGYSLLGIGKRFQLPPDALRELPDRLTALFTLSRDAAAGACTAACRLDYQDHRGDRETLEYRVLARERLSLPAGDFDAVRVEATEPDSPERRLVFSFHPDVPGLLLAMEYHRDGKRRSRLALTDLTLNKR